MLLRGLLLRLWKPTQTLMRQRRMRARYKTSRAGGCLEDTTKSQVRILRYYKSLGKGRRINFVGHLTPSLPNAVSVQRPSSKCLK
jgi:hypothetical protein